MGSQQRGRCLGATSLERNWFAGFLAAEKATLTWHDQFALPVKISDSCCTTEDSCEDKQTFEHIIDNFNMVQHGLDMIFKWN